ncbi:ATP-binding protein [Streptomyces axinellae]|uniref:Histidine kinase/HSP90-like ATPase domain-containing protein n=1 Tax=Streptomyces axinellae TaxID=552788 RepID=A0ABP6CWG4_9ACTN
MGAGRSFEGRPGPGAERVQGRERDTGADPRPGRAASRRPSRAEYVLPAEAASARWARRLTAGFLHGSAVRAARSDRAQLVVSELVTNAVRYGGGCCRLRLTSVHDDVTVEVRDDGAGMPSWAPPLERASEPGSGLAPEREPRPGSVGELEEGGRGLLLVRTLSRHIRTVPDPRGGKTVRAVLALH